jgi:beta-glucosidase
MNQHIACRYVTAIALGVLLANSGALAQTDQQKATRPWMNKALSADARADLVVEQLTLEEKVSLLHGYGQNRGTDSGGYLSNGGAGFIVGIRRLGLPAIQMSDAAYGVVRSGANGRYSTALPSDLAAASSWDTEAACQYGALIGRELRAQGYNMSLGGGVNLAREPRNGRTFEYAGEDPVLAGTMVGHRIQCEQAQHVIGDIKHYALNDQESGRNEVDVTISKRAARESDLLAFQIGIEIGNPQAVMCSYNGFNGDYSCENKYLLTDVLKKDWKFPGFVVSDWGGTHSTEKASAAGLDNEQPGRFFYGDKMLDAVKAGVVPQSELNDHVHRILRAMFAAGLVDYPTKLSVVDVEGGLETSQRIAEHSMVLLKNDGGILPLLRGQIHSIAVIGLNADSGMMSGGGSAQVDPPGDATAKWQSAVWFPTSPLAAIQAKLQPGASIEFASGKDMAAAEKIAARAKIAIVFVNQWASEGMDLPNLSLPDQQDALIARIAAANPHTIVVLETGTPVTMPWIHQVSGVLEAWYAGSRGATAVANILFGDVNPTAKLPITFPLSEADLPRVKVAQPPPGSTASDAVMRGEAGHATFGVTYDEGVEVGYKWYDATRKPVLFPFGFGLSYTSYQYSELKVQGGAVPRVTFTVKNTGGRAGMEIAEVYAQLPPDAHEPPKRLVGFTKVALAAGESKTVTLEIDPKYLSIYSDETSRVMILPGSYKLMVGGSSQDLVLGQTIQLGN